MTVGELIKWLAEEDDSKEVYIIDCWGEWTEATDVSNDEEGVYIE